MPARTHIVLASLTLIALTACASAPKEPSVADQIRARGEVRLDIAQSIEQGEAKIAKSQRLADDAAELSKDADKLEKRAQSYLEDAKEMRSRSERLKEESAKLAVDGKAQVDKAVQDYEAIRNSAPIVIPSAPATP